MTPMTPMTPTPTPTPTIDDVAPAITDLSVKGRRVRFTLSEAADVRLAYRRRCRTAEPCPAPIPQTRALLAGAQKVARPRLRPGRWKLVARATDVAGNRSPKAQVHFSLPRTKR